jgi:hypothetical protein
MGELKNFAIRVEVASSAAHSEHPMQSLRWACAELVRLLPGRVALLAAVALMTPFRLPCLRFQVL